MKTTKIYRLENPDAKGPYLGCGSSVWNTINHDSSDNHPGPRQEKGLLKRQWYCVTSGSYGSGPKNYKFGFESIEQLNSWFDPFELTRLNYLGFNIVEIEITEDAVFEGSRQVLFNEKKVISKAVLKEAYVFDIIGTTEKLDKLGHCWKKNLDRHKWQKAS